MPQARDEAGNIWEVDAQGNPVRLISQAGGPAMPADPTFDLQRPQAEAALANTQAQTTKTQVDANVAQATAPADIDKARADADRARAEAEKARIEIERARMDMQQGKDPEAAVRAAKSLLRILDAPDGLQDQFNRNLSGTNPLEYLPFPAMRSFDAQAGFVKPAAKKLFRAKGEGSQSDAENRDWEALTPSTWNTDETNAAILENLRAEAVATLEEYGEPVPEFKRETEPLAVERRKFSPGAGPNMQAAAGEAYSTPDDMAVAAAMQDVYNRGGSPQDMAEVARQFNYPVTLQNMTEWQEAVDYRDARGKYAGQRTGFSTVTPPQSGRRSLAEQAWGDFAASPLGTAGLAAADAATFGTTDEIAGLVNSARTGRDYTSERDYADFGKRAAFAENPTAANLGTLAGGIAGGVGIAGAASRLGSRLPAGAFTRAQAALSGARGAAAEGGAYGAAYGAGTANDDRLSGAITGGVAGTLGGVGGYGAVRTLGGVIGGVADDATRRLADRGVTMTPGQILRNSGALGRTINRLEEGAESIPGFSAIIRQRREDSFRDFNRTALDDALKPIEEQVSNIGEEGIEDAFDAVNRGYSRALDGVEVSPDQAFMQDLAGAGANVTPDNPYYGDFQQIVRGEIRPTVAGRTTLRGQDMQDLLRMAQGYGRNYRDLATKGANDGPKPFARPVAEAFEGMGDSIEGLVQRQSPGTIPAYNAAKEAYRNVGVLRDAVNRARVGTQSGEGGVFTPAQLALDSKLNAKKFGGTQGTTRQPFFQLTRDAQEVLPAELPNSGTFDRAVSNAMLGAPVIGAGVAAQQGWIDPQTAAAIAAASALYSKGGTKAVTRAAVSRPDVARKAGKAITAKARRAGLFGAPLVLPLALQPVP